MYGEKRHGNYTLSLISYSFKQCINWKPQNPGFLYNKGIRRSLLNLKLKVKKENINLTTQSLGDHSGKFQIKFWSSASFT